MSGKVLARGIFLVVAILWAAGLAAGERVDWLLKQKPALAIRSEKGMAASHPVLGFEAGKTVETRIGRAQSFEARVEGLEGKVSLRAEELTDLPAMILWLELKDGMDPAEMGKWEMAPIAIELDQPNDFPRSLSFANDAFAPPKDTLVPSQGPAVFYNDNFETVLVSPLDHFMVSLIGPKERRFQIGLEGDLKSIPAGFDHPVIFYFGQGMRNSFIGWGDLLLQWHNQKREGPYSDVGLSYLGYWTDNGSYYYYKTEPGMNYQDTLLAVKADADRAGVPFRYFQMDSWWYFKSEGKRTGIGIFDWVKALMGGGVIRWEARPDLLPDGLSGFQKKLNLPLIAHNRWYDKNNDYRRDYQFVDGVGDRNPAFPIEDRFWEMIMENAKNWGVEVYEQDWLLTQWDMIPYLRESVDAGEKWLKAMSRSAEKRGLTIQYCMANPGMFMQSAKYPNITQVRPSGDYLAGAPKQMFWIPFTKTSMLAWAVGLYPWKDVFLSSSGQRAVRDERHPEEETLISILSAAMVGPGDRIGSINKDLLMRTCRRDGLLLKPDLPAMPIDRMFVENNTLYTIITESRTGIGTYYYVAGFNIFPQKYRERELSFQQLGIGPGKYLVYDWKDKSFQTGKDRVEFPKNLDRYRSAYYVAVPDFEKTPALIGEQEKFITVSKARFPELAVKDNKLKLTIAGVPGEELELRFRAEKEPVAKIISGASLIDSNYEASSALLIVKLNLTSEKGEMEVGY